MNMEHDTGLSSRKSPTKDDTIAKLRAENAALRREVEAMRKAYHKFVGEMWLAMP